MLARLKIPEKLSGLSVKGGAGVPTICAKGFLEKWFSAKGVGGGGYPLSGESPLSSFECIPYANLPLSSSLVISLWFKNIDETFRDFFWAESEMC